jgi:hypothetical protein
MIRAAVSKRLKTEKDYLEQIEMAQLNTMKKLDKVIDLLDYFIENIIVRRDEEWKNKMLLELSLNNGPKPPQKKSRRGGKR